jgi:hypothetical protein
MFDTCLSNKNEKAFRHRIEFVQKSLFVFINRSGSAIPQGIR